MLADKLDLSAAMDETETPKFTVSQIVLLQKLRQSGLTKNQILKGLDEMEKLDEMGLGSPVASVPGHFSNANNSTSPRSSCSSGPVNNGNVVQSNSCGNERDLRRSSSSPQSPRMTLTANVSHQLGQPNPLIFGAPLQNGNQLSFLSPVAPWPNTSQAVSLATAAGLFQNNFGHGTVPHSVYPNLINGRVNLMRCAGVTNGTTTGNTVVEIDDKKVDITDELEELFRRDQASVKEDIRKFIIERHISQSAIAKATRNAISQSYISQWLAQPQDISGQKKKAMYTWFIVEKRKSPGISNALGITTPVSYHNTEADQENINTLMLKSKRGARFTWPKECLAILENYYNSNAYPDECKREEIATACNEIIQSIKPGMILSDLDRVTTVKVYNWFANRRKDDKRRRHIEHIETMGHQHITLSPRRNSTVSPSPSCNSNDSNPEADNNSVVNERVSTVVKEEHPISLALEMAAVNNSILALVNAHNGGDTFRDDEEFDRGSAFSSERFRNRGYSENRSERMECRGFAS